MVVIALVVAGLAIAGVFGGSDKKSRHHRQTTPTTSTPTTSTSSTTPSVAMPAPPTTDTQTDTQGGGGGGGSDYPASFRQAVHRELREGRPVARGCVCAYARTKKAYSFPELLIALKKAQQGNSPAKIKNIFIKCAQENS